mgnify:CR=1 FL=1
MKRKRKYSEVGMAIISTVRIPTSLWESRPIDEESGRRTAARLGRKYHVAGATVQKYAKYSAALDAIEQNAPELVPHILSGAYKISFENISCSIRNGTRRIEST